MDYLIGFLGLSVILGSIGVYVLEWPRPKWMRTVATVIYLTTHRHMDGENYTVATFKFKVPDSDAEIVFSDNSIIPGSYRQGDSVPVLYDPHCPSSVVVAVERSGWGLAIWILVGAMLIGLACLLG